MYLEDQNHSPEIFMDCPVSMLGASKSKFHMKLRFNAFSFAWGIIFTYFIRIIVPLPVRVRRKNQYLTSETCLGATLALKNKKKKTKRALCALSFMSSYRTSRCIHICISFCHFMKEIELKFVKRVITRIQSQILDWNLKKMKIYMEILNRVFYLTAYRR